eukprot:g29965.t1
MFRAVYGYCTAGLRYCTDNFDDLPVYCMLSSVSSILYVILSEQGVVLSGVKPESSGMLYFILSPTKTQEFVEGALSLGLAKYAQRPHFPTHTEQLVKHVRTLSKPALRKMASQKQ